MVWRVPQTVQYSYSTVQYSTIQYSTIHQQCRYSIALWLVADSVETINPYVARNYVTRKHFSYFKFYIGDNVQRLVVTLSNCTVLRGQPHSGDRDNCIEYAR